MARGSRRRPRVGPRRRRAFDEVPARADVIPGRRELQRREDRVEAKVQSDEDRQLHDLGLRVVSMELVVPRPRDDSGVALHLIGVAQGELLRVGESWGLFVVVGVVKIGFGDSELPRRGRADVRSVGAGHVA